jgi:hypothetical protein
LRKKGSVVKGEEEGSERGFRGRGKSRVLVKLVI